MSSSGFGPRGIPDRERSAGAVVGWNYHVLRRAEITPSGVARPSFWVARSRSPRSAPAAFDGDSEWFARAKVTARQISSASAGRTITAGPRSIIALTSFGASSYPRSPGWNNSPRSAELRPSTADGSSDGEGNRVGTQGTFPDPDVISSRWHRANVVLGTLSLRPLLMTSMALTCVPAGLPWHRTKELWTMFVQCASRRMVCQTRQRTV